MVAEYRCFVLSSPLKYSYNRKYQDFYEQNHSYYDDFIETKPRKKKKVKKKNALKKFFTTVFALGFLGAYGYFVCPYNYTKFFEPIFLNRILNRNIKLDVSNFSAPTLGYLHNSFILDSYALVPRAEKSKEISEISILNEMTNTKQKLLELTKKYPRISPSIFVWEYSTGSGLEMNANEIYPAASIIKIPIAFELIRLVDKSSKTINPVNLTDKKIFSEDFRTIGSGDLQYTKGGVSYSLDYLANIMIANSDNSATNMILHEIGGMDGFNRAMRNLGLKSTYMAEWLADMDGNNKTTAKEISKILYNIDNPNYINPKYKNILKEYLGNTKNSHLLKETLPADAMVLHKTGDVRNMLGDSGVIYTDNGKKYIVTIMVKRQNNDYGAKLFINEASKIIYDDIKNLP